MSLTTIFNKLIEKESYSLEFDDFTSCLVMYPAALVAMADGDFGPFERVNVISALKEATAGNEFKSFEMYRLLTDLLKYSEEEKNELLAAMKDALAESPENKLAILELMISTAEAEDGISEIEKNAIDQLKTILSI